MASLDNVFDHKEGYVSLQCPSFHEMCAEFFLRFWPASVHLLRSVCAYKLHELGLHMLWWAQGPNAASAHPEPAARPPDLSDSAPILQVLSAKRSTGVSPPKSAALVISNSLNTSGHCASLIWRILSRRYNTKVLSAPLGLKPPS